MKFSNRTYQKSSSTAKYKINSFLSKEKKPSEILEEEAIKMVFTMETYRKRSW